MRFPYSVNIGLAGDSDEFVAILRPEIPVHIHGPLGSAVVHALVDTGADQTILPLSVATRLGIETKPITGPGAKTFGGQEISFEYGEVDIELTESEERLAWTTHVCFTEFPDAESESAILGHQGILECFTATFYGEKCELEMTPNKNFPLIQD